MDARVCVFDRCEHFIEYREWQWMESEDALHTVVHGNSQARKSEQKDKYAIIHESEHRTDQTH